MIVEDGFHGSPLGPVPPSQSGEANLKRGLSREKESGNQPLYRFSRFLFPLTLPRWIPKEGPGYAAAFPFHYATRKGRKTSPFMSANWSKNPFTSMPDAF